MSSNEDVNCATDGSGHVKVGLASSHSEGTAAARHRALPLEIRALKNKLRARWGARGERERS